MNEKRLREIEKTHHDMCETSEHIDELSAEVRKASDIDRAVRTISRAREDESTFISVARMAEALESLAERFKDEDFYAMCIINKGRGLL